MPIGSMKVPIRPVIEAYRERYISLKKRFPFQHRIYQIMPGGHFIAHIKVPSETITEEAFYYDVLLELAGGTAANFSDCHVKFFSNCPSFVYNLSYVMAHWHPDAKLDKQFNRRTTRGETMLIPDIAQKLGPRPTKDKPVVRNPLGIPMLDKSLYYAIFYLMETTTWPELMHTAKLNPTTMSKVAVSVADFDKLMVARKRAVNKETDKKASAEKTVRKVMEKNERSIQSPNGVLHAKTPQRPKQAIRVVKSVKTPSKPRSVK